MENKNSIGKYLKKIISYITNMNLYHGSTAEVRNSQIIVHKNRGLDFGYGFIQLLGPRSNK